MARKRKTKNNLIWSIRPYAGFIYLSVALTLSCEKDYSVIDTLDDSNELPIKQSLVINPDSGTVGTRLRVHGIMFNASPPMNSINFEGVETFGADSGTIDTIYTYVPFGASSGSIEITYWDHDTIGVFDNFKFIPECDTSSICVIPYNLNVVLTEKNARQIYSDSQYEQAWSGEIQNDIIVFGMTLANNAKDNYFFQLVIRICIEYLISRIEHSRLKRFPPENSSGLNLP